MRIDPQVTVNNPVREYFKHIEIIEGFMLHVYVQGALDIVEGLERTDRNQFHNYKISKSHQKLRNYDKNPQTNVIKFNNNSNNNGSNNHRVVTQSSRFHKPPKSAASDPHEPTIHDTMVRCT